MGLLGVRVAGSPALPNVARSRSVAERLGKPSKKRQLCRASAPVPTGRSAFDGLLGLLPDRDVAAARAGEGREVPVAPPIAQSHPGKASHEIQL
jgi:hypothetical protein